MAVETMHPPSRHFVAVCRSDGDINWMYTLMGGAMRTCSWSQKTLTCSATQRACSVVQQWQTDTSTGAAGADDVVLLVLLLLLLLLFPVAVYALCCCCCRRRRRRRYCRYHCRCGRTCAICARLCVHPPSVDATCTPGWHPQATSGGKGVSDPREFGNGKI